MRGQVSADALALLLLLGLLRVLCLLRLLCPHQRVMLRLVPSLVLPVSIPLPLRLPRRVLLAALPPPGLLPLRLLRPLRPLRVPLDPLLPLRLQLPLRRRQLRLFLLHRCSKPLLVVFVSGSLPLLLPLAQLQLGSDSSAEQALHGAAPVLLLLALLLQHRRLLLVPLQHLLALLVGQRSQGRGAGQGTSWGKHMHSRIACPGGWRRRRRHAGLVRLRLGSCRRRHQTHHYNFRGLPPQRDALSMLRIRLCQARLLR